MASGLLGKAVLTQNANTIIYTAPSSILCSTGNINMVNTSEETVLVKIAIGNSNPPALSDYIEYAYELLPGCVVERTGIVISPSEKVICFSNGAGVVARIHGYEEVS